MTSASALNGKSKPLQRPDPRRAIVLARRREFGGVERQPNRLRKRAAGCGEGRRTVMVEVGQDKLRLLHVHAGGQVEGSAPFATAEGLAAGSGALKRSWVSFFAGILQAHGAAQCTGICTPGHVMGWRKPIAQQSRHQPGTMSNKVAGRGVLCRCHRLSQNRRCGASKSRIVACLLSHQGLRPGGIKYYRTSWTSRPKPDEGSAKEVQGDLFLAALNLWAL